MKSHKRIKIDLTQPITIEDRTFKPSNTLINSCIYSNKSDTLHHIHSMREGVYLEYIPYWIVQKLKQWNLIPKSTES